jgi:dihydroneopterin aldolase
VNFWWSDPRLVQCRRIFLREVLLNARIGVHDFERQGAQRLVISVDLFVPMALSTPQRDKLSEVVDYDFVRSTIRARLEQGHINLQETLVDDLARMLLEHPAAVAVRVSSEKPDVYADVAAVGIEVFKFKA